MTRAPGERGAETAKTAPPDFAPVTVAQISGYRLARHHLDTRAPENSAVQVCRQICGLHAQVMSSADLSLWARVRGHQPGDLSRALWQERTLVKTWLMRGTLHLVPAEDLPFYTSALDPRGRYDAAWLRYFEVTGDEMERLIEAVTNALDGRYLTRRELSARLAPEVGENVARRLESGWGEFLKPVARRGRLVFGPSENQAVTFARPDQWLGHWREVPQEEAQAELLRRYLRAYGPATADDFDRWVGSGRRARFRPAWAALADEVVEVAPKRFLLKADLDSLERASPSGSLRLLPAFDPYLLGHQDRSHLVEKDVNARVYRAAGWVSPVLLESGRVAGVWSQEKRGSKVQLTVDAFRPLSEAAHEGLVKDAEALARYLGGELDLVHA